MSTRNILQTKLASSNIPKQPLEIAYNLPKDDLISLVNECDFIINSWKIDKYKEIITRKINLCLKSNPEIITHKDLIEKFCQIDKWYEVFKKREVKIQTKIDERKLMLLRKIYLDWIDNFPKLKFSVNSLWLKESEITNAQIELYIEESWYKWRIESLDNFLELFEKWVFDKIKKEKVDVFENPKRKEEIQDLTKEIDTLFNVLVLFWEKTDTNDLLNDNMEKKRRQNRENIKIKFSELTDKFSQLKLCLHWNESLYEIWEDVKEKYKYIDALISNLLTMIDWSSELILDIYEKNILELKARIEPFKYLYEKINKAKKAGENDII